MEIIPGQGIPQVPLGADRQAVHAALGVPSVVSGQNEHHNEPEGFSVWSMGSLMIEDIDQPGDADEDDEVVEGVSIAAAAYFEDM